MLNKNIFWAICLLITMPLHATSASSTDEKAIIDVKIGIELNKIEQSIAAISVSIEEASHAFQALAKDPHFDAQQQEKIVETFEQLAHLAQDFDATIAQIPMTIEQATPPISEAIDETLHSVTLAIIMTLVFIILLLICALIAIYFWMLKPAKQMLSHTTEKFDKMTTSLEITARIVEKSTQQQLIILGKNEDKPQDI